MKKYEFLAWFFIVPFLIGVGISTIMDSSNELKSFQKITGKVKSSQLCNLQTNALVKGGRMQVSNQHLCIEIENCVKTFTVFNALRNYERLSNEIKGSDFLTVYYNDLQNDGNYFEVVHIQNSNQIIYSISQWKRREIIVSIAMFCVAIIFTIFGVNL